MHLLLYIGPASLIAAVGFLIIGDDDAAKLAVGGWVLFSLISIKAKPRNVPELIMTWGNALLLALGFFYAIITGRPG